MKKSIILLSLLLALAAVPARAQYVYSDGTNALSSVRELPSQGLDRRNGRVIVGLHGADPAQLAACGWWRVAQTNIDYASGFVCISSSWRFASSLAVLSRFYAPPPFRSFTISKYRLCEMAQARGKLDALISFIDSDPRTKFLWDAAQTLDRTNALVVAAEAQAASAFGLSRSAVSNLLWEAREK